MSDAELRRRIWQRNPGVLWRRSFDRVVLLPGERDDLLLLEGVGAAIWQLLEQPATTEELVDPLAEHYQADRDVVAGQVEEFLSQLDAVGAVHQA